MWSACLESREIIEKHYEMEYWAAKLRQDQIFERADFVDACMPFVYLRSGEDWRFPIYPNRDLVCLQPLNVSTVGFYRNNDYFMDDYCMVN